MNKLTKILLIICVIILFLLLFFSVIFSLVNIPNEKILNNISIEGIDVSGMTKEEAKNNLNSKLQEKLANNITINYNGQNLDSISFENLQIDYNINDAIKSAYDIGRNSNIFKSNYEILNLKFNKINIDLSFSINGNALPGVLDNINNNIPDKLVQSGYYIENNDLILTAGEAGNIIDVERFKSDLYNIIADINNQSNIIELSVINTAPDKLDIEKIYTELYKEPKDAYYEENPLQIYSEVVGVSFDKDSAKKAIETPSKEYIIPLQFVAPNKTIYDLDIDFFKDTLGFFTTKYNITKSDRSTNLELAAEKINGTIIAPGEIFSYNKIVGARTIEKGYKEAKIYSNGQVVDGIGGGICQISSTLYDTVVLANLEITERHNHQFVTSYLPAGKDATVSYGVKDLKFKNTRSYPIKIEMVVENGIVTCKILGLKEQNEYDINIETETVSVTEPEIIYEQDNSLNLGQEKIKQYGSNGTIVNVYKITKKDKKKKKKELLSNDTYKSLEKIILHNQT